MNKVLIGLMLSLATLPASAQLLDKADENGDGVITRAEFQTSRVKAFEKMDRNDDGFLDQEDAPKRRRAKAGAGERLAAAKEQLDTDGDSRISRAEFAEAPMLGFDRADADKDGKLNSDEIAAFKELMKQAKEARSGAQ